MKRIRVDKDLDQLEKVSSIWHCALTPGPQGCHQGVCDVELSCVSPPINDKDIKPVPSIF